jgi:pimeloyl-ACP methyl ester carboxylesterase
MFAFSKWIGGMVTPALADDHQSLILTRLQAPAIGPRDASPIAASNATGVAGDDHGRPIVFGQSCGFFYAGSGPVAILMLSPVGYEEICARTTWRSLAERLAAANLACLRFDYPGVGDALISVKEPEDLQDWYQSIHAAADALRRESGCSKLIVIGQGLGATFATLRARNLSPVEALVLMAPISSGSRYLRELSAWSKMLSERIGIERDPDDETGCSVAGFSMPKGRLSDIKTLDLLKVAESPCAYTLLVGRPQYGGDEALAEKLHSLGVEVTLAEYHGFGNIMTDPTQVVVPQHTLDGIVDWIEKLPCVSGLRAQLPKPYQELPRSVPVLEGDGFCERPFRFGPGGRMFGILCTPTDAESRMGVVFIIAGRDYHIGWAGMIVEQARALAALGIASLRFDGTGIGDSPAAAFDSDEVLYSTRQITDVRAAIDQMEMAGFAHVTLIGRCSGAYAALHAAAADSRIQKLVMINAERFVWDPDERVEDALRYAHRSLGDFGATLWKRDGVSRLLLGKLSVVPAARYIFFRFRKRMMIRFAPLFGSFTKHGRLYRQVHGMMRTLARRQTQTVLIFSEGDVGLVELQTYFGRNGRKLAHYPNMSLATVKDADHNFTHYGARQRLLTVLRKVLAA